jgi:MFS family permease
VVKTLSRFLSDNKYLLIISLFTFLLIYLSSFNKSYGYFIDEFYYIACANNPAAGYVDQPPLAPLLLTVFQFIFGNSIYAIRVLPALGQAATVFTTGLVAREIGGGKLAQFLAACALAATPVLIAFGGFYSMNAFEPLLATLLMLYAVKMIKENNSRHWITLGIIMGVGMMNKHTFGVFIIAFIISLILAGKWKLIFNKWFVYGGLCGFIIFLPNIIWQIINNYPSLEFYRNISVDKNVYTPPLQFIMGQVMNFSPSTIPMWVAGFLFLLFSKSNKEYRFLGFLFLGLFLFMMLSGTSRADRLAFAYPAAFVGGGVFFERVFSKYNYKILKIALVIFLFSGLALALPIILPYFSYETVLAQTKLLGINTEIEKGKKPLIPQLLADRIGWEEKFKLVLSAYNSLSDEDKKHTIIAAGNYGQAGALELFGKENKLPPVACSHNNYYLWSKNRVNGNILLQLGNERDYNGLKQLFDQVELLPGMYKNKYVSPHENNLVVFLCRRPKIPLIEMLERSKNYH